MALSGKKLYIDGTEVKKLYLGSKLLFLHKILKVSVDYNTVTINYSDGSTRVDTFSDCIIPSYQYEGISCSSVEIGNGITEIGESAFGGFSSIKSITFQQSSNLEKICNSAFESNYELSSIILPDSLTSIGDYAFSDCASLTSVTIPNSVTSIGEGSFAYCNNLIDITFIGTIAEFESIDKGEFWNESISDNLVITCTDGFIHL